MRVRREFFLSAHERKIKYKYITRQGKERGKSFLLVPNRDAKHAEKVGKVCEFNLGIFQSVLEFNRLSLKGGYKRDAKTFADVGRVHTHGNHFVQMETKKQKSTIDFNETSGCVPAHILV